MLGGLHTSFRSLKANLLLSSCVALTGIAVPIGLSYTLQGLLNATPVQAFAAGAALCSTSLGTTFTVLNSSGLSASRLGVVLTSAAMMDDVVGLVMVQVISNLGGNNFSWVTVVRPVLVSVAFAVASPLVCHLFIKPVTCALNRYRNAHTSASVNKLLQKRSAAFVIHTWLLISVVAGATYAGTSNLFAAYIVGASISWWDSEVPHVDRAKKPFLVEKQKTKENVASTTGASSTEEPHADVDRPDGGVQRAQRTSSNRINGTSPSAEPSHVVSLHNQGEACTGSAVYEHYYVPAVSKILQPLFFASVGFSIPITKMFRGSIVWRGIVYTVLMAFAKFVCGFWLVRFSQSPASSKGKIHRLLSKLRLPSHFWGKSASCHVCYDSRCTLAPYFELKQLSQSTKAVLAAPTAHPRSRNVRER
jgi:Kef-type K+ transport system membrane component KefB